MSFTSKPMKESEWDNLDKDNPTPKKKEREPKDSRLEVIARKTRPPLPENFPETPKLPLFDVNDPSNKLPKGFFIICEGSRRVGKSIFHKWLLYYYRDFFDQVIVCSETPQNGFWQPIVSNQYVHNGWDPFIVEQLFKQQGEECAKAMSNKHYKAKHPLVILDDIVGDRNHIHEDATLNKLAVQGRHSNIAICLTTQEPHAIGTSLRNNCDMAVIFQQKSERAKKSVCNDFLKFKLKEEWQARDLLETYTENHDAILIKMFELKHNVEDAYKYVPESMTFDAKTEKVKCPDYQLGSAEQKRLAKTKAGSEPIFDK
jgi:hypothetical protein